MQQPAGDTARPVIVVDVLGTIVDQAGSLQRHVSEVVGADGEARATIVRRWLDDVAEQERAIVEGRRTFVASHELDAEALERLADDGLVPRGAVDELVNAASRLQPWPDSVAGLDLLSTDVTVIGLSNASRRVLTGLSGHGGLRWHQVLSAEDANTYKPDPAIYGAALNSLPPRSERPFMVAAHAWDLRAAATAGLRTAYVPRPDGDPPRTDDAFDLVAASLDDLHAQVLTYAGGAMS